MNGDQLSKEKVLQITGKFLKIGEDLQEEAAIGRVQPVLWQYRLGLFQLVVVGEIKKGKSSFINALLGKSDLLPTMSDVATSTVFKIAYGDTIKYKVFFLPEDPEKTRETTPQPLEVSREQVADYGTEDGNPRNKKRVNFIGVLLPHPLLKSGVTIIDTPGLGGLFREHSDITWRYVPSADAIFFILDSVESVASKAEMDYLQRLRKLTPLLFFVQTKIDLAGKEQWQQWRDRNLEIISSTLAIAKEKLIYFPVSSELKKFADEEKSPQDLNASGFTPLLYFLHEKLLKNKERRLASDLLNCINMEAVDIRRSLNDKRQVINAESKEKLDALEREYIEEKARFEKWRKSEFKQIKREFEYASKDLKNKASERLQTALDPTLQGTIIRSILDDLQQKGMSASELVDQAGAIQSTCIDLCSQQIFDIQGQYNQDMKKLLMETLQRIGKSSQSIEPAIEPGNTVKGVSLPLVEKLNIHFSGFEKARNMFFGTSVGSTMFASIPLVFFPPAAAVAAVVGAIAGYLYTQRDLEIRREEQAINKLQGILRDTVQQAYKQAMFRFSETAQKFDHVAGEGFENAAEETEKEIEEKLISIADLRKNTHEEIRDKLTRINEMLKQTETLLADIAKLTRPIKQQAA